MPKSTSILEAAKISKKSNYYIGSRYFVVFYVQNCPFSSFSRLRSPLCALKK